MSSGDVSPTCSDYGGGLGRAESDSDTLCRKLSKDSAIGSTDTCDYQLPTSNTSDIANSISSQNTPGGTTASEPCSDVEVTTPTVKVWPVEFFSAPLISNEQKTPTPAAAADNIDLLMARPFFRSSSHEDDDLFEDSETLSDVSQHSSYSQHGEPLHRTGSEELIRSPPLSNLHRQLSDSSNNRSPSPTCSGVVSPTTPQEQHSTLTRPSVSSLTSLDDYFSQLSTQSTIYNQSDGRRAQATAIALSKANLLCKTNSGDSISGLVILGAV